VAHPWERDNAPPFAVEEGCGRRRGVGGEGKGGCRTPTN